MSQIDVRHIHDVNAFYVYNDLIVTLEEVDSNRLYVSKYFTENEETEIWVTEEEADEELSDSLWANFICNFLKKEKLYTKLKYSRSPQYDIVSGGLAALFSAFIGFLISEKFGIELVDSGDFYILFMYAVFVIFSIKPLIKIINKFDKLTPILTFTSFITLSNNTSKYFIYNIKRIIIKLQRYFNFNQIRLWLLKL